jgi:ABC-type transport system involved in cytochrome c biogenesis ATPase subunit
MLLRTECYERTERYIILYHFNLALSGAMQLIDALLAVLRDACSLSTSGPAGCGRTSLLRRMLRLLQSHLRYVTLVRRVL